MQSAKQKVTVLHAPLCRQLVQELDDGGINAPPEERVARAARQ